MIVGNATHSEGPNDEQPLYPIEGRFISVADRSYVLGLPKIDREEILAERAAMILRRQEDLARTSALAATPRTLENNKKRKRESEIEASAPPTGEAQHFTVHKHLICASSKFFEAVCSKLCAEGKEKVVHLPEVKVNTFQAYLVWVYTGKVITDTSTNGVLDEHPKRRLRSIIDLYLLGGVMDDLPLRNAAIRSLVNNITAWSVLPSLNQVNHIWASTPPGSRLRQVIVDVVMMRVSRSALEPHVTVDHPVEFLHSIAMASLKQLPTVSVGKFASGLDAYLEPEANKDMEKSN